MVGSCIFSVKFTKSKDSSLSKLSYVDLEKSSAPEILKSCSNGHYFPMLALLKISQERPYCFKLWRRCTCIYELLTRSCNFKSESNNQLIIYFFKRIGNAMYVNGNTFINCCCCCICVKKTDKNLAWLGVRMVTSVSRGKEMSGHFYTYGWFFSILWNLLRL